MTTWLALIGVGLVSYLFRAGPLLLLGGVRISDRVDRTVRHAGAAAVTALMIGAMRDSGGGYSLSVVAATATALVLAAGRSSMLRVVLGGGAVYAAMAVIGIGG
jgi:branched-subunit amino acid transport protein